MRSGAGRRAARFAWTPRKWAQVKRLAENNSPQDEILACLEIPSSALASPSIRDRFNAVLRVAHAKYRAELRTEIKRRGLRTTRQSGSVNALALQARNELGYDQEQLPQEAEPQVEGARQRLRDTLERLRRNVQQREGKPVTIADLLANEARNVDPQP